MDDSWSRDIEMEDESDIAVHILKFMRLRETFEFERTCRERYTRNGTLALTVKARIALDLSKMRANANLASCGHYIHHMHGDELNELEYESKICMNNPDGDSDEDEEMPGNEDNHFFGPGSIYRNVADQSGAVQTVVPSKPLWRQLWTEIEQTLSTLMIDDTPVFFRSYNLILKLHIDNRISLDPVCFSCLILNTEPAYVNDIFSRGLVSPRNVTHIKCLYENRSIFSAFHYTLYTTASKEPFLLLLSITVLLYRTVCLPSSKRLSNLIMKKLVPFINRNSYSESFKKVACKHFLKAVILNNLFNRQRLNSFLTNSDKSARGHSHDEDEDDDAAIHSDSDLDDEDDMISSDEDDTINDEDEWENDENNNNRINNNNNHAHAPAEHLHRIPAHLLPPVRPVVKTVSDHIGVSVAEMNKTFPLSLKDLCRLRIKSCLKSYTPNGVDTLTVLPRVLKRFLLFQDEIDTILKLAEMGKLEPSVAPTITHSVHEL